MTVEMTEKGTIEEGLDPRVRRTRQWLQGALLALLQEKPYADISITDITKQADLARVTFYQHFMSKEELLLRMVEEIFVHVFESFDITLFMQFVEQGDLTLANRIIAQQTISPEQLLLIRIALTEIGPSVRNLAIASFLRLRADLIIADAQQREVLATYHVGGILALWERILKDEIQGPPDGMRTVPLVFLRALRLAALENNLLGQAMTQPQPLNDKINNQ